MNNTENQIARTVTRYVIAYLKHKRRTKELMGCTKVSLVRYFLDSTNIVFEMTHDETGEPTGDKVSRSEVQKWTKERLVSLIVDYDVNLIDLSEELDKLGVESSDLDLLVDLSGE